MSGGTFMKMYIYVYIHFSKSIKLNKKGTLEL